MSATSWTCAQCSATFDKSKLLERHALQTSHKAYRCTKCPGTKSFGKRTAFIRHKAIHTKSKSHACRVCQKAFFRKDHCQEHEEVCTHRLATATKERLSADLTESREVQEDIKQLEEPRSNYKLLRRSPDASESLDPSSAMYPQSRSNEPTALSASRWHGRRPTNGEPQIFSPSLESTDRLGFGGTEIVSLNERQQAVNESHSQMRVPDSSEYRSLSTWNNDGNDMLPSRSSKDSNIRDRGRGDNGSPDFPARLTSMESSEGDELPSNNDDNSSTGTYTCTYHGCTQRFDSPARLQRHKREFHRPQHSGSEAMSSPQINIEFAPPSRHADLLQPNERSKAQVREAPKYPLDGQRLDASPKIDIQLYHTESQAYQDELYNPNFPTKVAPPRTTHTSTSPHSSLIAERLKTANWARSAGHASELPRHRSPFKRHSPLAPVSVPIDAPNSEYDRKRKRELKAPTSDRSCQEMGQADGMSRSEINIDWATASRNRSLPEALLELYPALRNIDWSNIPQDAFEEGPSSASAFYEFLKTPTPTI